MRKFNRPKSGDIFLSGNKLVVEDPVVWRAYEPDGAVYKNFAVIDGDDGIVRFANRFGFLRGGILTESESLEGWHAEIIEAKRIVWLIETKKPAVKVDGGRYEIAFPDGLRKGNRSDQTFKSQADAVRWYITWHIQEKFKLYPVSIRPEWDKKTNKLNLAPEPLDLLALIWYQIAVAASADAPQVFQCVVCGTWAERFKNTRETCSVACKQKLWRMRKNG